MHLFMHIIYALIQTFCKWFLPSIFYSLLFLFFFHFSCKIVGHDANHIYLQSETKYFPQ